MQSEIFRDFSEILQRLRKHARQFPWRSSISVGKWNSVTRITHLEGTEGKISPKSYRIRFKEIPMATIHGQNDPVVLPCCFSLDKDQTYPRFLVVKKVEGRSQIRRILFTRRQLPDHDRTMTESLPNTHLKDCISSMSLFIPNRIPELILLFTCLVQEGRLCPHWTKVAEMGKY